MLFTELDLNPDLMRGIQDLGFETTTDVQSETFTRTLKHQDVAVQSQTGTGKTAAFLITIFQLMNETEEFKGTRALIVAPTRELAVQIENDAKALGKYLPQRTGCFYGGVGYNQQERDLADKVDIVIGTPGRLLDFNQSGKLDFREMGILVIDEADRLFDMGFYPDIRKMMRRARPRQERLTMLYSATLSVSVRNISWQFMNDPAEIEIEPERMTVDTVKQELYHVAKDEKFSLLLGLLRKEKPRSALIFCNTKRATEIVAKKLQLNGYECEFIIGDLPQKKRSSIIERVKAGDINMLTATDVAARGLHVDDLDLVVNYDLPEDSEAYVHRIGRTARAGREGKAISLACERFVYSLEMIEELIGMKIPTAAVTDDLLAEDESAGRRLPPLHHSDRPPLKRGGGRSSRATRAPHGAERSRDGDRAPADRGRGGERTRGGQGTPRGGQGSPHGGQGAPHGGQGTPHHPRHAAAEAPSDPTGRRKNQRSGTRRPDGDRSPRPAAAAGEKGPTRDSSMSDRIAYYREKYGEEFVPSGGSKPKGKTPSNDTAEERGTPRPEQKPAEPSGNGRDEAEKSGLLDKLTGIFKRRR